MREDRLRRVTRGGWLGLLAAALASLAAVSPARAVDDDGALWATVEIVAPIGSRFSAHLMLQPRFISDITELQSMVVRPWLEVKLGNGFTGALGYSAHIVESPVSTLEQRSWEEVAWSHRFDPLRIFTRLRLEQRFFQGQDTASWRTRLLAGVGVPLGREFELIVRDEIFVTLNQINPVLRTGVRENRFYAGIGRALGEHIRADIGYQMQWLDPPGTDLIFHTLMLGIRFDVPGLP